MIQDLTTKELIGMLKEPNPEFTAAEVSDELAYRLMDVEDDPENLGYRGGTRPTHQSINP